MSIYKWLLDAGHGGLLNSKYTTAPAKQFKFEDGLEIYEGLINRQITSKLIALLQTAEIDYGLVYDELRHKPCGQVVQISPFWLVHINHSNMKLFIAKK